MYTKINKKIFKEYICDLNLPKLILTAEENLHLLFKYDMNFTIFFKRINIYTIFLIFFFNFEAYQCLLRKQCLSLQ